MYFDQLLNLEREAPTMYLEMFMLFMQSSLRWGVGTRAAHPRHLSGTADLAGDGAVVLHISGVRRLEAAHVLFPLPRPELAVLYFVLAYVS